MEAAFGNWLAGFIDGEGCFAINIATPRTQRYYRCIFTVRVRIDDAEVINLIHRETGFGRVFVAKGKAPTNPSIGWMTDRRDASVALAALLTEYPLRAKKARDFAIWHMALKEQCGAKDKGKMQAYKEALSEVRRYEGGELELSEPAPPQLRLIS